MLPCQLYLYLKIGSTLKSFENRYKQLYLKIGMTHLNLGTNNPYLIPIFKSFVPSYNHLKIGKNDLKIGKNDLKIGINDLYLGSNI